MRNNFGDHVVGRHQAEISLPKLFQGECPVFFAVKLLADVFFLLVVCSVYDDIAETEFRHFLFESHAFLFQQTIVHTTGNPVLDGIHQFHSTFIADVVKLVKTIEVHQAHIIVFKGHENTCRIRHGIVRFLHDHAFQLSDNVSFLRLPRIRTYHAADNNVRMKVLRHYVDRKIVVYPSVIRQHGINLNGLEHARKTHGGTHGISQITFLENNRTFVIHIGGYAAEWHEQPVKIPSAERRSLPEQLHER